MTTITDATTGLDTAPLTAQVKRRDVRAFYRVFRRDFPVVSNPLGRLRRFILGVGAFVCPIGFIPLVIGAIAELQSDEPDRLAQAAGMGGFGLLMAVAFVVLVWSWRRLRVRRDNPERHYRFAWFANANGWGYVPGPFVTMHLTPWIDRGLWRVSRVFRSSTGRPVEIANYELMSGPQGSRNTQFGGYAALRLTTSLPHILLQSRADRVRLISNTTVPVGAQRLSLEGNFDEHFTLYCPEGYERDALYLFTPDVMARLIDDVSGFDVEIMDDWLFLTSRRDVVTLDPARWVALTDALNAVGAKVTRWERWRDDYVRAPSSGERMRHVGSSATNASPPHPLAPAAPTPAPGTESAELPVFASLDGAGATRLPGDPRAAEPLRQPIAGVGEKGQRLSIGLGWKSLVWIVPVLVIGGLLLAPSFLK